MNNFRNFIKKMGFSIAEMMMVLVVISIVAAMVTPLLAKKITTSIKQLPDVQPGTIIMYSGNKIPKGWVLCDGKAGRTPDLRGKFIIGAGNSYRAGDTGGQSEVVLAKEQLPNHMHYFRTEYSGTRSAKPSWYWGAPGGCAGFEGNFNINFGPAGGGQPHYNIPPYYKLVFIMKI